MKVCFHEPPPEQRVGGLDGAIRSLEAALRNHGIEVLDGTDTFEADLVHFHGIWQPAHSRISAQLAENRVPFLVSPHGMLEPWAWRHKWWKKWPYFFLRERAHLRRSQCLLATAPTEARRLQTMLPGHRVEAVPLGFTGNAQPRYADARAQLGWTREETVLLFLSRLHTKKGLDLLLRALSRCVVPQSTRLVIVGGGEPAYVKSMQALAQRLALPRVDWIGEVWGDARWAYFQGADLFCLPSHSENFGLAVLEACQVGTLTLTTNQTPWETWLKQERGIIVSPDEASIAAGLTSFFTDQKRDAKNRTALAEWARSEFSWAALTPRYAALYQSLTHYAA